MSILHRRRRVYERQEESKHYTREDLEAMSAAKVRAIVEGIGLEHQNKRTSIDLILEKQEEYREATA